MPLVRRRPLAGLAALGAAALIAGCGGGSDSMSADEFREQADAICAEGDERVATIPEPTTADQVAPSLEQALSVADDQLARLGELDPPDELQTAFDEAQDLNQQRRDLARQAVERIQNGEDPQVVLRDVSPELERLQEEARAKARELGLTICGREDDEGASTAGGATATAPEPTTDTTGARGETAQYREDVGVAVASLRSFSSLLQGTTSLEDLQARVPEARAELDRFDAAIASISDQQFDNATLEGQRGRVAKLGPQASEVLDGFLDAAESGDSEAMQSKLRELNQVVSEFRSAVSATP